MVGVAQLVRAPVCGTGGCGFKSHHSPKNFGVWRSPVSAPALGAGGRRFESSRSDHVAEVTFLVLTGRGLFEVEGDAPADFGPGGVKFRLSRQFHAMTMGD